MTTFFIDPVGHTGKPLAVCTEEGDPWLEPARRSFYDFIGGGQRQPRDGHSLSLVGDGQAEGSGKVQPETGSRVLAPQPGDLIVTETTFENHTPAEHNAVIDLCEQLGIGLLVLPIRITGRLVKKMNAADGLPYRSGKPNYPWWADRARDALAADGLKTYQHEDLNAAAAIRACYRSGQPASAPRRYTDQLNELQQFNRFRTGGGLRLTEPWVRERLGRLGPWYQLQEPYRSVLGDPPTNVCGSCGQAGTQKNAVRSGLHTSCRRNEENLHPADPLSPYALGFALLCVIAADQSDSRREFDRRMGLYAHGYPSIFRSTAVRRAEAIVRRSLTNDELLSVQILPNPRTHPDHLVQHAAYQAVRAASRYVYHLVSQGKLDPETGTPHPDSRVLGGGLGNVDPAMGTRHPALLP